MLLLMTCVICCKYNLFSVESVLVFYKDRVGAG